MMKDDIWCTSHAAFLFREKQNIIKAIIINILAFLGTAIIAWLCGNTD